MPVRGFEDWSPALNAEDRAIFYPRLLRIFRENRGILLTNRILAEKLGIPDAPRIRALIHQARVSGDIPLLLASSGGYRQTKDPAEAREYIESLGERIRSIAEVKRALEDQLAPAGGQQELFAAPVTARSYDDHP